MSRQELEIERLWRQGLGNGAIATAMGVTVRTVQRAVAKLREAGATQPPKPQAAKPDAINAQWVRDRLVDISLGVDATAGAPQIAALKALLDMIRSQEANPAEMSLSEKVEWLKRSMTPDEFIVLSDSWVTEDRARVYRHLSKTFKAAPENHNVDATDDVPR